MDANKPGRRGPAATYRWIRQLHLWVGAWGALAAILYGITGLVMNHRFGDGAWPQGDSIEAGRTALAIRKGGPGGRGGDARQPPKWNLSGGTARNAWSLEYAPGSEMAELKQTSHTTLAALNRLHKGVGGGGWWILLADSFAIGMLLLGLSGIWMWARGRSAREMLASVMGLSTLAFVAVVGLALL